MSGDYQLDLFGGATPIEEIKKSTQTGRISKKELFRRINGYDREHTCGECENCITRTISKKYFKCTEMGVTAGPGTDIRKSDVACKLWTRRT